MAGGGQFRWRNFLGFGFPGPVAQAEEFPYFTAFVAVLLFWGALIRLTEGVFGAAPHRFLNQVPRLGHTQFSFPCRAPCRNFLPAPFAPCFWTNCPDLQLLSVISTCDVKANRRKIFATLRYCRRNSPATINLPPGFSRAASFDASFASTSKAKFAQTTS